MKWGGRTLGSASEVSYEAATHCHSPQEPPVPTGKIATAVIPFFLFVCFLVLLFLCDRS